MRSDYGRTPAGQESHWGQVTVWEPPARLAYLRHIGADAADATDVEIAFVPLSESTTRVDILHRGWDRLGEGGRERRDTNRAGWDHVGPAYPAACAATR